MRGMRPVSVVVFVITLSALVGGTFGRRALAVDDKVPEAYKVFSAAISAIEANYVESIDSDRLVYRAVRGMLGTLDPHSRFFDPEDTRNARAPEGAIRLGIPSIGVGESRGTSRGSRLQKARPKMTEMAETHGDPRGLHCGQGPST